MRLYDGLQRFQLYTSRDADRESGEVVPARELASALRHGPRDALERVVDFLVREYGWYPGEIDRHEAAVDRLVELIDLQQVTAMSFRPSGSVAGEVPDQDDEQALSDLVEEEEEDEVAAGAQVEAPMGIEPESQIAPPVGFEVDFEVGDPQMPDFDFEVG